MSSYHISLLGGLSAHRGEGPITSFKSRKERALLVRLLLAHGHPLDRVALAVQLWPDSKHEKALKNLRVVLARLRRTLEEGAVGAAVIEADRTRISLADRSQFDVDVWRVQRTYTRVSGLSAESQFSDLAAELTTAAVETYTAHLLTGFTSGSELFDEWLDEQRRSLQAQASWLAALAVRQAEKGGRHAMMAKLAQRLISWNPWDEQATRWRMEALVRQGNIGSALASYARLKTALAVELNAQPSRPLAAYADSLQADAQPVAQPRERRSGNIPAELTPYFGRSEQIEHVVTQLQTEGQRLISIVGPGGSGKTSLSLVVARTVAARYADAAWLVELAGVSPSGADPATSRRLVLQKIASALGIAIQTRVDIHQQVTAYLAQRHLLLVLDNFEHLLSGADVVLDLPRHAPLLSIVVTSREPLGYMLESVVSLDGLAQPPLPSAPSQWERFPASRLFVSAARRVAPKFAVDETTWPQIIALCEQVKGSPLALILAAAQLRVRTLGELIASLDASLDVLHTTARDLPERHRSLPVMLEGAWASLSAEEQRVFRTMSVLPGSFTAEAAVECSGIERAILDQLVQRSLIERSATGRLALHPLWRQFVAGAKADADEVADVEERAGFYFLKLLETRQADLFGLQPLAAARALVPDLPNIQLAWQVANRVRCTSILARTLPGYARLHWVLGLLEELGSRANGPLLLEPDQSMEDRHFALRQTLLAANALYFSGEAARATAILTQVETLPDLDADQDANTFAQLLRGDLLQVDGKPDEARVAFEAAYKAATAADRVSLRVQALSRLNYFLTGTLVHSEAAVRLAQRAGDLWLEARALRRLAISEANAGFYESARRHFRRLAEMPIWLGPEHHAYVTLCLNQGNVARLLGAYAEGARFATKALALAQQSGNQRATYFACSGLSNIHYGSGEYEAALHSAEAALEHEEVAVSEIERFYPWFSILRVRIALRQFEEAQLALEETRAISERVGLPMIRQLLLAATIDYLAGVGKLRTAIPYALELSALIDAEFPNPTLEPVYVIWQAVRGFEAVGDPRARQLQVRGVAQIQQWADRIDEPLLREQFLRDIRPNRALLQHSAPMRPVEHSRN